MLRFSFEKLCFAEKGKLDWNAFYEVYVVHSRNLYDFLTSEGGQRNYNARDYVPKFKSKKTGRTIEAFRQLHAQVLHLGKRRPVAAPGKFNFNDCKANYIWIEDQFGLFIGQLGNPFASAWAESLAATRPPYRMTSWLSTNH